MICENLAWIDVSLQLTFQASLTNGKQTGAYIWFRLSTITFTMQFMKFSAFACDPSLLPTRFLGKEVGVQQGLNFSTQSSVIHLFPPHSPNKCFDFTLSSAAKRQFYLFGLQTTLVYKWYKWYISTTIYLQFHWYKVSVFVGWCNYHTETNITTVMFTIYG